MIKDRELELNFLHVLFFMKCWQALTVAAVDSHCLARLFENLPAPPKHYGVFDILLFRKVFAKRKNLGSH